MKFQGGKVVFGCMNTETKPIGQDFSKRGKFFDEAADFEESVRSRYSAKSPKDGESLLVFGPSLIFWEQDAIIDEEVQLNLSLAGAGVFIMSLLTLQSLVGALLATVSVGFVDVCLFGVLWLRDMRINSITGLLFCLLRSIVYRQFTEAGNRLCAVINLVIAVGLSVRSFC